jgi:ATP-dependent RNA helicase DeaD
MKAFRAKQIRILVATDVASRGIDVNDISHVIHYQLPDEIETYTHRSGRTGRATNLGTSMIILTKSELGKIRTLERIINAKIVPQDIPEVSDILSRKLAHFAEKIKATKVDSEIDAYLTNVHNTLGDFSKEELVRKLMSLEFNRLNTYYQKQSSGIAKIESDGKTHKKNTDVRYTINIGSRDDYHWRFLKSLLVDLLALQEDDVYHVDVMRNHSYFNTAVDKKEHVLATFDDFKLDGRSIQVRLTEKRGQHLQKEHGSLKKRNRRTPSQGKRGRKEDSFFADKRKKKSKKKSRKK